MRRIPSARSASTCVCGAVTIGTRYFCSQPSTIFRSPVEPVDHERRRALGMDQVDLRLGELLDALLEVVEDALEFVDRPLADIDEERQHADPVREEPAELFDPADARASA